MKSLWNDKKAKVYSHDLLGMRVYSSRLLGQNEDLVLHGGGNTSVKLREKTIYGEEEILYVKGSGWDLSSIQKEGFAPVKMRELLKLGNLKRLSDSDMVTYLRAAMTNPYAPTPSIEALLHALIPYTFVDHTHADAVLTITNSPHGEQKIRDIYGKTVLVIPYIMPGFILAKEIARRTKGKEWSQWDGILLMNHGIFTFDKQAKISYEKMIHLVSKAEAYINKKKAKQIPRSPPKKMNHLHMAQIRKQVSTLGGKAVLAQVDHSVEHQSFSQYPHIEKIANRGPITPDHVIRTKRIPVVLNSHPEKEIGAYGKNYRKYFNENNKGSLTCLDAAPRWAVWRGHGTFSFGRSLKEVGIISDIVQHTIKVILQAETLGGWRPLSAKDLFAIEYWELEQAKLKKGGKAPLFQGKVAVVSGAASGIGKACVENLVHQGAVVAALDINPKIQTLFHTPSVLGLQCDVTNQKGLEKFLLHTVERFGGIDLLVSNAGIFPKSMPISKMDQRIWNKSLDVNLSSHQRIINICLPYLELGVDPAIVVIGSKNVPAPGPGASAYSVAKAGLTQLARVAALELGSKGIRVNVIHPHAVYDTNIWTPDVLKTRAKNYGMSVEKYKTNNLLRVEITSKEVAALVTTILGPVFSKITGAQIPIDGGNERVI